MLPSLSSVTHQGHSRSPSQHDHHQFPGLWHMLQLCSVLILQAKGGIHLTNLINQKIRSLTFATGLGSLYSQWREICIQEVIMPPVSGQAELLLGGTYITPRKDEIKPFRHARQGKCWCCTYWQNKVLCFERNASYCQIQLIQSFVQSKQITWDSDFHNCIPVDLYNQASLEFFNRDLKK